MFANDWGKPTRVDDSVAILADRYADKIPLWPDPSNALVQDIERFGIRSPIVQANGDNGWIMIAGRRRLKAAILLDLQFIPALYYRTGEVNASMMTVSDNATRSENPRADIEAIMSIMQHVPEISTRELSDLTGMSIPKLNKRMRLMTLPHQLLAAFLAGEISVGAATRLAGSSKRVIDLALDELSRGNKVTTDFVLHSRTVGAQKEFDAISKALSPLDMVDMSGFQATNLAGLLEDALRRIAKAPKSVTRSQLIAIAKEAINEPE